MVPTDPQARAASVLAALGVRSKDYGYWSDEDWRAHVAAALAEAGLLAGPTGRACAICTKAANAARAELAEVRSAYEGMYRQVVALQELLEHVSQEGE